MTTLQFAGLLMVIFAVAAIVIARFDNRDDDE